eukprot:363035_1
MSTKASKNTPLFSVDYRSLALFRIGICVWVFQDLFRRWYYNSIEPFLTNDGILPNIDMNRHIIDNPLKSILFYRGTIYVQYTFFIIHIINTICLFFGYHVTLTSILNYLLIYGLHHRNHFVLNGGDLLFRCLSFIFIFSSKFSVHFKNNNINNVKKNQPKHIKGINISLLLIQCWILYPIVVINRFYNYQTGTWLAFNNGDNTCTSVYLALTDVRLATSFGYYIASLPSYILYLLCIATNVLEVVFPTILLFTSNDIIRYICLLFIFCMQIMFNLSMRLDSFLYSVIIALVPFIPSSFWENSYWENIYSFVSKTFIGSNSYCVHNNLLFVYDKKNVLKISLLNKMISTFFFIYLIFQNLSYSGTLSLFKLVDNRQIENYLGIDQKWRMFGPDVDDIASYDIIYLNLEINNTQKHIDLMKLIDTNWNNTDILQLDTEFINEFIGLYKPTPAYHKKYIKWTKYFSQIGQIGRQSTAKYFCSKLHKYYYNYKQKHFYINNMNDMIYNINDAMIMKTQVGFCKWRAKKVNMWHRNGSIWDETSKSYNYKHFYYDSELFCKNEWIFSCSKYIINYEYYNYYEYYNEYEILQIMDKNENNEILYIANYWYYYMINKQYPFSLHTLSSDEIIQIKNTLYNFDLPLSPNSQHILYIGDINEIFYFVQNLFDNWCEYLLLLPKKWILIDKSICYQNKQKIGYLSDLLSKISPQILNNFTFDNFEWMSIVIDTMDIQIK